MSKSIKVNICPFVHPQEPDTVQVNQFGDAYAVICMLCGAIGPISETPEEAIEQWNGRNVVVVSQKDYKKAIKDQKLTAGDKDVSTKG